MLSKFLCSQSYREGLQLLCQAYGSDPSNPAVLNLLAHHCLTRKNFSKVSPQGVLVGAPTFKMVVTVRIN